MPEYDATVTRTVKKAMDILDCLGEENHPLAVSEIGHRLGMPRSTVYRLLNTLAVTGYVTQDSAEPQKYRLGFKVLELASRFLGSIELRRMALPFLEELRNLVNETVHLVVPDGGQVAYVEKVECSQAVRMHSTVGSRVFMHCTAVGKALLAFMTPEEVEAIVTRHGLPARTPNTITDRAKLFKHLEEVRRRGYAIDNVENEDGIRCVGAPIFDHQGRPVAALSVSGPAFRLTLDRVQELIEPVRVTAQRISRELGSRGEEHKR